MYVTPEQALEHPVRALLCTFIESHPGATKHELGTVVGVQPSSIQWHLRKLESAGLIGSQTSRGSTLYHSAGDGRPAAELALATARLRSPQARQALARCLHEQENTDPSQWRARPRRAVESLLAAGLIVPPAIVTPLGRDAWDALQALEAQLAKERLVRP